MSVADATGAEPIPWIDYAHAARFLGCGRSALQAIIDRGELTVRQLPGCRSKVRADEVLALARRSTRPATRPPEPEMANA